MAEVCERRVLFSGPGSISGFVFHSETGAGYAGGTVYLDLNHDGKREASEYGTPADRYGHYLIGNLPAGTYVLRETGVGAGYSQTYPAGGAQTVAVSAGRNVTNVSFGNAATPPPGAVLANGVLTVTGTAGADRIDVTEAAGTTTVTVNGTSQTFPVLPGRSGNGSLTSIVVNAGDGNDTITVEGGNTGTATLNGQGGNDAITVAANDGSVSLDGGDGNDTLTAGLGDGVGADALRSTLTGDAGDDTLTLGNGVDQDGSASLAGGDGNDTFDLPAGLFESTAVDGGVGTDALVLAGTANGSARDGHTTGSLIDLTGGTSYLSGQSTAMADAVVNVENVTVDNGNGAVKVIGSASANVVAVDNAGVSTEIDGNGGDDQLTATGPTGGVTLNGGDGNDTLASYGDGPHGLSQAPASVVIDGGAGNNDVAGRAAVAVITAGTTGSDVVGFVGTTRVLVNGGSGPDQIYVGGGTITVNGNGGNDTIGVVGPQGFDGFNRVGATITGGDGNDTIVANDDFPTTIDGGAGTDTAYVDATGDTVSNVEHVFPTPAATALTGTVIGTAGSYHNLGNTIANAVDGDLGTYFDGPAANGNYVGLDFGSATAVAQVRFAPRPGLANRMVGGQFQASNTADFSAGVVTAYTVAAAPVAGSLTIVSLPGVGAYRYWRYLSPAGSYGDVAEVEFDG